MKPAWPLHGAVVSFLLFLLGVGASAQTTVLSEGFEGTFPGSWSVGDANSTGTPAYWGKVTLPAFGTPPTRGGSNACYCAGVGFGGSSASPTYQDSMNGFMSRSINLAGFSTARLSFWYVIPSVDTGFFATYDYLRVKIDGTNLVFSQGVAQSSWTQASINLDAYVGGTHTLTFEFTSDGSVTYEGAYIDDILLVGDDPDDQISEAAFIGAMTQTRTFSGQLNSPADVDMVSFTVSAGQRISFDIDRPSGSTLNSVLRLFDSSGNQLPGGFSDDTRGPGETNTFDSYLEYAFTNSGIYYVGVSSYPNTNYSGAAGTNDANGSSTGGYVLVVSPGLAGTAKRDGDSTDYPVDILPINGKAIDPAKRTWIVTHGWTSSRAEPNIAAAASNLALRYPQDQVLTLDWSSAASSWFQLIDGDAEDAIKNVGRFAADALRQRGFTGDKLNLVGHSWGSYVSDELAEEIPGGVNTIVALDPGENYWQNNFYDPHAANGVNFAQHSMFSWAFYSEAPEGFIISLFGGNYGDEETPTTADEAITVQGTTHGNIVFMFAELLLNPFNVVAPFFDLDRLLAHSYGPWQLNQLNYGGVVSSGGGYEAVVTVGLDDRTPTGIGALWIPPSLRVMSASAMVITNNESQPLLGKGTDFGTLLAGGRMTNFYTLGNLSVSNLFVTSVTVPSGFQVVTSPAFNPIGWATSTPLSIRFAPQSSGIFGGDVVIYNTAGTFRFAVTGTATNAPSAPAISAHPTNQFAVAGSNVLLSVSATGTPPLFYHWQKNGQPITGATNSTLNLTNLVRSAGGTYSVFVTNHLGTATSSNAIVRVVVQFAQAPVRLGNGHMRLVFGDPVNSAYTVNDLTNFVVEATTSVLSPNWVRYTDGFTIVNGMVQFDDPDAPLSPRRFYRVIER